MLKLTNSLRFKFVACEDIDKALIQNKCFQNNEKEKKERELRGSIVRGAQKINRS